MTKGGRWLENQALFARLGDVAIEPWKVLSYRYTLGASGKVNAFTKGVTRTGSVWNTVEHPTLWTNPNITNIFMR